MEHRDGEKKRRRIPPALRRRALASCDRCKKRRIKCLRPDRDTDHQAACQTCVESGNACESTFPRKQRIYGSVEKLSTRYRLLDALVKGLYPNEDTQDTQTLHSILDAQNIEFPSITDEESVDDVFSRTYLTTNSPARQHTCTPRPTSNRFDSNPFRSNSNKVPEEKLISTPNGQSHYIGPSSSFGFVIKVRSLVAELNAASKSSRPEDERAILRSDFAGLRTSIALEPHSPDERERDREEQGQVETVEEVVANQTQHQKRKQRDPPRSQEPTIESTLWKHSRKDPLIVFLPSRAIADALVEAYFDKVHPHYILFHRSTFQLRFESTWTEQKKPIRSFDQGWICCLFMTFVFGAQVLEHHDKQQSVQIQRRYLGLVLARVDQLIVTTSLFNIQALLLLQLHQHNTSERNTAWMLLGCASRMALALGMHREGATGGFDSLKREVRKRVWWTMFVFEQHLCTILGRPSGIDDSEVNVSLPNETLLDSSDVLPGYLDYSVRLTRLLMDIKRRIYTAPIDSTQPTNPNIIRLAKDILLELDSWHYDLPPYIRLEGLSLLPKHRRAVLLLHIQYHYAQELVTRPFLLRRVSLQVASKLEKPDRPPDLDRDELTLSHACGYHAQETVYLLHQLATEGILDGVAWIDVYYLYHSVLILSVDFLARPYGQVDTADDLARKTAVKDVVSAVRNTQFCPTFAILTQVALQLAKIVGIFDDPQLDNDGQHRPETARSNQILPEQQPAVHPDFGSQGNVEDIINQMLQNNTADLSWDFFGGLDAYGGMESGSFYNPPIPMAGTFASGDNAKDDSVSSIMMSENMYTNWNVMENPMVQQSFSAPGSYDSSRSTVRR
jgi:proline utilization trans-activator